MKQKVYVETTVIQYLISYVSEDLVKTAKQRLTQQWWKKHQPHRSVHVSKWVLDEIDQDRRELAPQRKAFATSLPQLAEAQEAYGLAARLIRAFYLPEDLHADAMHIALAAVHRMDVLLTWNQTHMANIWTRDKLNQCIHDAKFKPPLIATPMDF